jgi:hypothetical protein
VGCYGVLMLQNTDLQLRYRHLFGG